MPRTAHSTLTANTVKTVTIDAYCQMITIVNRSQTGAIYFTVDGTVPTILGDNTYVCLGVRSVAVPSYASPTQVQLIGAGALDYSVVGETQ